MQLLYCFFYLTFFFVTAVYSQEYVYPVAFLDNGMTILFIHQSFQKQTELLQWNTQTNQIDPVLCSMFNPAGVKLLPDSSGFSFIDNGRLRIKSFNKRSPKAIDFDEPFFNISSLEWIDAHSCYCSAQQGDYSALFELHDNGMMHHIAQHNNKDCMYPQKIDSHLFYIERFKNNRQSNFLYQIMHTEYPDTSYNANDDTQVAQLNNAALGAEIVAYFEDRPIVFLNMCSQTEGFVVEHADTVDTEDKTILFLYHRLIQKNDAWQKELLFSFSIPCCLLMGGTDNKLYESLVPLLPQVIHNRIYFVNSSQSNEYTLEPYCYDIATGQTQKIIVQSKTQNHIFVPMLCGKKFYCGGIKNNRKEPLFSFLT